MATHTKTPAHMRSFDVCVRSVIGTVTLDENGDHSPHEAAFLLIARHSLDALDANVQSGHPTQGDYSFLAANGETCNVFVSIGDSGE